MSITDGFKSQAFAISERVNLKLESCYCRNSSTSTRVAYPGALLSPKRYGAFFKRSDHFIHSWLTSPFHLDINVLAKLSNFVEQWVIVGLQFANGVIALLFVDDLIAYARAPCAGASMAIDRRPAGCWACHTASRVCTRSKTRETDFGTQ